MIPWLAPVLGSVTSIIDKVIPDPGQKAELKAQMEQALLNADLQKEVARYQAIVAEAQSEDKWTSRARPSFMYVMYVLLLFAIPYGILYTFNPTLAMGVAAGMKSWFGALPSELYTLFGVGYVGYSASRTVDKFKKGK